MKGEFHIDGDGSYENYRLLVEQYGYRSMVAVPGLKNIEVTEWPDEDGIEADLSAPVLAPRTVSMPFVFTDINMMSLFYNVISDGAYHTFGFTEIGLTVSLRLLHSPSLSSFIRLGRVSMTFIEDAPSVPSDTPYEEGVTRVTQRGYLLDGVDLSRFGCWVLDGSIQSVMKAPSVKENIVIGNSSVAGQTYLPHTHKEGEKVISDVFFKAKDATLKLLINARGLTEFWKCWNALFHYLTLPGEKELAISDMAEYYSCYYKSCNVVRFDVRRSGTVWCEFDLTLTFLSFRPGARIVVLSSEAGEIITTEEDGAYINLTLPLFDK